MSSDIQTKNALSKGQREVLVLDLYFNQNKTYSKIAKIARVSPRDIRPIIEKARTEKERKENRILAVQAYELYSSGRTTLQTAIELNIGEGPATQYYTEYLKLSHLDKVNQLYKN
jgi:hypothetical protein